MTVMANILRSYGVAARSVLNVRSFAVSSSTRMPRQNTADRKSQEAEEANVDEAGPTMRRGSKNADIVTLDDLEPSEVDDASSFGHLVLQQQRQMLYYMRLIEHEMPLLAGMSHLGGPPGERGQG